MSLGTTDKDVEENEYRRAFDKKTKNKKGKKNKKKAKPSVLDHHFHSKSTPAFLRPGDVVLRRVRKDKKKVKPHDTAYEILTVAHFNGEVETDGYMHSPTQVNSFVRNWDGSSDSKVWTGVHICTQEELNVLRPLNRGE